MKPKVVQVHARRLNSIIEKTLGLISLPKESVIYFETRWGVHTFFVKHPIDVCILDYNFHVVCVKKNLIPSQIYLWNPKYFRVIESYSGNKKLNKIKIEDKIKLL